MPSEKPPFHSAASRGDLAELERLAARGADLNAYFCGLTPLMVAAGSLEGAGVETLRWLIEHGADLHRRCEYPFDVTAAWYAAGPPWSPEHSGPNAGLLERLRFLLDVGLDARESASNGRSLIVEAASVGDAPRVRLLLERGASPDPRWDPTAGQALPQPPPESERNRSGYQSYPATWKELQVERLRPNPFEGQPSSFQIPLFCAATSGSADCVRLLLAAGVPPDSVDEHGATALSHAGSPEAARALLEAGADFMVVDRMDYDPLQKVIEEENALVKRGSARFAIARVLIEAGANLERRDRYGHATRLYLCAFRREAEAVQFLLECGANPHAAQEKGRTALHAACWWSGAKDRPELNEACERIIDLLIAAGTPVDQADDDGRAPIHEAAGGDGSNPAAIRALLRHGAVADLPGRGGGTPLMIAAFDAAFDGGIECIRLLLAAGADPLRKDGDGRSALDRARARHRDWLSMGGPTPEGRAKYADCVKRAAEALRILEEAAGGVEETGGDDSV